MKNRSSLSIQIPQKPINHTNTPSAIMTPYAPTVREEPIIWDTIDVFPAHWFLEQEPIMPAGLSASL